MSDTQRPSQADVQRPSQAEGEREYEKRPTEGAAALEWDAEHHPDVPHTTPSQAEGAREEDEGEQETNRR